VSPAAAIQDYGHLSAATNISMSVTQAWGIIVAVCTVFGVVIIFLVKVVLKFWQKRILVIETGHTALVAAQDVSDDRQKDIAAKMLRTAEILQEVQESVKANTIKHEELKDKVNVNEALTRDSTHGIRTLLATEFVTKRDHEKLQDRVGKLEIDMPRTRRQDD
jgi:NTP pyrophosphatase (non-canonical NTP hydrolase)